MDPEKLIQEIFQRPWMYDITLKTYHNRDMQEQSWSSIAEAMSTDVGSCKKVWTGLRESKTAPSGSGSKRRIAWYLAEQMSFLAPFMKHRSMSGNISTTSSSDDVQEIEVTFGDIEESSSAEHFVLEPDNNALATDANAKTSGDHPPRKEKRRRESTSTSSKVDEAMLNFLSQRPREEDPDRLFLLSILPEMKQLIGSQKINFKKDILTVVEKYVD